MQITAEQIVSALSLGISSYQAYENRRMVKLLRRIHKNSFRSKRMIFTIPSNSKEYYERGRVIQRDENLK